MEFSPFNTIVKLCVQGMELDAQGKSEEACKVFLQGWHEASDDFEKFLAAYYVSRCQNTVSDKVHWLETSLNYALKVDDPAVASALPTLYSNISECYRELNKPDNAKTNADLAASLRTNTVDKGPFYHGTRASLNVGDFLLPGGESNYQSELKMNHIYFTALVSGAGLAAALARGEGKERVYVVEPTGPYENDPNLTDKKFPGNPTRSYRSTTRLKIVAEITDWARQTPEQIQQFRKKVKNNKGEIIN